MLASVGWHGQPRQRVLPWVMGLGLVLLVAVLWLS